MIFRLQWDIHAREVKTAVWGRIPAQGSARRETRRSHQPPPFAATSRAKISASGQTADPLAASYWCASTTAALAAVLAPNRIEVGRMSHFSVFFAILMVIARLVPLVISRYADLSLARVRARSLAELLAAVRPGVLVMERDADGSAIVVAAATDGKDRNEPARV